MDASPLTYASAEAVYAELERLRAAGILTDPAYRAQLNSLRIKDELGRTWMIQERTGRWHVWERGAWAEATPPGREPSPDSPPAAPERSVGMPASGIAATWPPAEETAARDVVAPADLPPAGVVPPPPTQDVTSRLPGGPPALTATVPGHPSIAGSPAVYTQMMAPPVPIAPPSAATRTSPPAPVLPPPAAVRAVPPPPTLPPPPALVATSPPVGQAAPGPTGKRARRDRARADRPAARSRRGFRYVAWSIVKWDVLWCLLAWAVGSTVGDRAPWALIPVAALALLSLVLWIRRLPRRHAKGAV